uniref:EF-hand domain-containing protein n=1 Tax=Alexandrium monilatum TaxID=311494 RepID=A0A7S4R6Z4_9DINO
MHRSAAVAVPGSPSSPSSPEGRVGDLRRVPPSTESISGPWWRPRRRPHLSKTKLTSSSGDFLERQGKDDVTMRRRGLALLQREFVQENRAVDEASFLGAHGAEGFRQHLRRKYGSSLAGWRALDWDCSGMLSLNEFCAACRRMGFHGNLKQLWSELDTNGNGFVSMMEIDPEAGNYIARFKLALMHEYGDMLTAWQKGIDTNGNGIIDEREIRKCCERLKLDLDPRKLFEMLRSGPKDRGMTLQQFDTDAWRRFSTGDFGGLLSKPNSEFLDDFPPLGEEIPVPLEVMYHTQRDGIRKWRQTLFLRDRAWIERAASQNTKYRAGVNMDNFRDALRRRHRSLLCAWRKALDPDGRGRISFGEFVMALGHLSINGELRSLWEKLDPEARGYITFGDLDPDVGSALSELQAKFTEKHGNLLLAWLKGIDPAGNGFVSAEQFTGACADAGFKGDCKSLFHAMLPDTGRTSLTLKDFDTKAHLAYSRGDFRMLVDAGMASTQSSSSRASVSFYERQKNTFAAEVLQARKLAETDEFAKTCRWSSPRDGFEDTQEDFEGLCKRKYGSIVSAWRNCLDYNGTGRLTFCEFCKALRLLGYSGNVKKVWRQYDPTGTGCVALRDLDPVADEIVSSFLHLLTDRYGDVDSAWVLGLRKPLSVEFAEACTALGYEHNPRVLFKALLPVRGRHELRIWDVDPQASRQRLTSPTSSPKVGVLRLTSSVSEGALLSEQGDSVSPL